MTSIWHPLPTPTPELYRARLQLHHALQIAASVGHTFVPPAPDQSHSNLEWREDLGALIGKTTAAGYRAGLRFEEPTLLLLDAEATPQASLDLRGVTQDDGYRWLARSIAAYGTTEGDSERAFVRSPYDLPDHPSDSGAPFEADDRNAEGSHWYGNAQRALERVAAEHAGASPIRCWPHHFDIATLVALDPDADDPEEVRSVGVGMTPGDHHFTEPYWYVTLWPYPADPELPALAGGGSWYTEGWLGAVLLGSELEQTSSSAQEEQVAAFQASAVEATLQLLDRG
jgi:hypothetical protein